MMLAFGCRLIMMQHRGLAVGETDVANVFDRIDHAAQIGQANRRAVAIDHDQIPVVLRFDQLIAWSESGIVTGRWSRCAFGPIGVGACEEAARSDPGRRCTRETGCGFSSTRTAGSELPPTCT